LDDWFLPSKGDLTNIDSALAAANAYRPWLTSNNSYLTSSISGSGLNVWALGRTNFWPPPLETAFNLYPIRVFG